MGLFIGIDFGTSTNLVTRWNAEKKRVDHVVGFSPHGERDVFPNVIYYESADNMIIGTSAERKGAMDPYNYVEAVKSHIGERNYRVFIPNCGRELTAEEIAKDIFTCIKNKIQTNFGGEEIDAVVISVPFAFQHAERESIRNAAEAAGLRVKGLIEEPVAAALSYGLDSDIQKKSSKILVFDLGGGTLDVTLFDFIKRSENNFAVWVAGTEGNKHLGGRDVDSVMQNKLYSMMQDRYPEYKLELYPENNRMNDMLKIRSAAIELKKNLSDYPDEEADIMIYSSINNNWCIEDYASEDLLNNELEGSGFLNKINNVLQTLMDDMEMEPEDIDKILLVGGSSNIPAVRLAVEDFFGKEPEFSDNVDELVGEGAAIYCGILTDNSVHYIIRSCLSHSVGVIERGQFVTVLCRNAPYGEESQPHNIALKNLDDDEVIKLFQWINGERALVGIINIEAEDKSQLTSKTVQLILATDNNGLIKYKLQSIEGVNIKDGYIEEDN